MPERCRSYYLNSYRFVTCLRVVFLENVMQMFCIIVTIISHYVSAILKGEKSTRDGHEWL